MTNKLYPFIAGAAAVLLILSCQQREKSWQLDSPDGQVLVKVMLQGNEGFETLTYCIYRKNENEKYLEIMDPSPLGIEREDGRFVENLEPVGSVTEEGIRDHYTLVSGKKLEHRTSYNQMELTFRNRQKMNVILDFRAYDYGVAFRYRFPGEGDKDVRVTGEFTGFDFKEGNIWAHPYDTITAWSPAYETYFQVATVGTPAPWNKNGWAFPLLVESAGAWMLVSESGFDGSYGASHLQPDCDNGRYMIRFAEAGEASGYYENTSHSALPFSTPWRLIAVGSTPGEMVETSLPTDLAAPCALEDLSWIVPGRASWSWWSDSDSPRDYKRLVPFVDLAADMEWEYSLVDAGWNRMENGSVSELARYAGDKNVDLLLWYNSGARHNSVSEEPRDLMENKKIRRAEFERISQMGIKGIKVDFFNSDKQQIIRQYLGILEDAAEYRLVVNFHGCTLPRGWRRTWPNLLTMESVRGGESYKFDPVFPEIAPSHLAMMAYTRNAVGPVDYTPCGFSDHTYPHLTTWGFELALPVVFESGIMHYMDTPELTARLPDDVVDFLKRIPVVWDDTRHLAGYPGKEVILARKGGDRWYLGGINGEHISKEFTLDLSLLGEVPDSAYIIGDGATGRDFRSEAMPVRDHMITIQMQPFGGMAGYLY